MLNVSSNSHDNQWGPSCLRLGPSLNVDPSFETATPYIILFFKVCGSICLCSHHALWETLFMQRCCMWERTCPEHNSFHPPQVGHISGTSLQSLFHWFHVRVKFTSHIVSMQKKSMWNQKWSHKGDEHGGWTCRKCTFLHTEASERSSIVFQSLLKPEVWQTVKGRNVKKDICFAYLLLVANNK